MGEVLNITACGSFRSRFSFRRYRRVENESHPGHCGSPQSAPKFPSRKTDLFSRTCMRYLGMPITVANHRRVLDEIAQLDYNGFLFRKSQSRSSFPLGECGIRRIQFRFPLADRKSLPQSIRIRSPDKTEHIRSIAVLPFHLEFLPPHPDIFCNTALDHLISDYAVSRVLQQH